MQIPKLKIINESESEALSKQWMEYLKIYVVNINQSNRNQILNEINCALSTQSFLGGNCISTADNVAFNHLSNLMQCLTFQEKEKFLHISRWYNTLQSVNENSRKLKFSRCLLYS